mmetsp:Transcript_15944/g.32343  ORF Transcript_15944/g.32343 Transcript_15944/m.32343 type:complete len:103 (+) Transcript_15944:241-549(+)
MKNAGRLEKKETKKERKREEMVSTSLVPFRFSRPSSSRWAFGKARDRKGERCGNSSFSPSCFFLSCTSVDRAIVPPSDFSCVCMGPQAIEMQRSGKGQHQQQ